MSVLNVGDIEYFLSQKGLVACDEGVFSSDIDVLCCANNNAGCSIAVIVEIRGARFARASIRRGRWLCLIRLLASRDGLCGPLTEAYDIHLDNIFLVITKHRL